MSGQTFFFRASMWLACFALVAIMMIIVIDVAMRHTINMPLRGAYDLVSIFLLIMIFSGFSHVILTNSEIIIDIVDSFFSPGTIRNLKLITATGTVAVGIYLLIAMFDQATSAYRYGDKSLELGLPVWTLWVFAYIGMISIVCASLVRCVDVFRSSKIEGNATHE